MRTKAWGKSGRKRQHSERDRGLAALKEVWVALSIPNPGLTIRYFNSLITLSLLKQTGAREG